LYLYTYQFDPTPASLATTITYLSSGLITGNVSLYPGQTTVVAPPGAGATQYPGLGSGYISANSFAPAFNVGGALAFIFQESTAVINGTGIYPFLSSQLSAGTSIYFPTGRVTVQQLAAPPQIFRYIETWNATPGTALTQYYYDSPIFLAGSIPIDPTLVQVTRSPAPGAQPTQALLFLAGNSNTEAYFTNPAGTGYFFTGNVTPQFDYPGTYSLTSADVKIFNGNLVTDYLNATGSLQVLVLATPEPSVFVLASAGLCAIALYRRKRR